MNKFVMVANNGVKWLVNAISQSTGINDAGKPIVTSGNGKIDVSLIPNINSTIDNSFTFNSDATNTGNDFPLVISRNPSQIAAYTFTFPATIGSTGQALFWSNTETTFRGITIADIASLGSELTAINNILATLGTAATKNTGTTAGTIPLIGEGNKLPLSVLPLIESGGTSSDSFVINSDATNVGSDRSLTLSRSPTQTASYSLIFPESLGTTGQILVLGNSPGKLEWGAGSQGASITNSAPAPNQILYKDPNWGLTYLYGLWIWRSRESGGESAIGRIEVGYFLLGTKIHIPLCGGGETNGNLKTIKIIDTTSAQTLFQTTLANTLISNTEIAQYVTIDTTIHAGKFCKLTFEDNDPNSGWAWIGVNPQGIFIEGNPTPPTVNESPCLNTILFKNANWGLVNSVNGNLYWRSRETGGESATGKIEIGYIKLLNNLHIALAGGGNTNGNLKVIKIFSLVGTLLISRTLSQLIGDTGDVVYATINTSAFANMIVYLSIEDNDAGSGWAWVGIDPVKIFVSN